MQTIGRGCPVCVGSGQLHGRQTSEAMEERFEAVEEEIPTLLKELGLVQLDDGLWVPENLHDKLLPIQVAALLKSFGLICDDCMGFVFTGCEECHGFGREKCPNETCSAGESTCPTCDGKKRAIIEGVTQSCPKCKSTGTTVCADCNGRGAVACEECSGKKVEPCRRCQGADP